MSEFRKAYGLADETQRLIESFVVKVKSGAWSGIQHKPIRKRDTFLEELLKKEGKIFTIQGIMSKEEAEKRGLEEIEMP